MEPLIVDPLEILYDPEGTRCVELRIPSRDLCVGQCFGPKITGTYPLNL